MAALSLSELYIYPIKSAAGIAVNEAQVTPRGLQYDRRWMVVDAQGKFMSQRRFPRMALIDVAISEELAINAPGMPALSLSIDTRFSFVSSGRGLGRSLRSRCARQRQRSMV